MFFLGAVVVASAIEPCQELYQIFASQSALFADRSSIQASIYAPRVVVGNDSKFKGAIVAPEYLQLKDRVAFEGGAYWNSEYVAGNQLSLSFSPERSAEVADCEIPVYEVAAGTDAIEVANGDQLELEPGRYGHLMVRAGASVGLFSGEYDFESIQIEPEAQLYWTKNDSLPVIIKVARDASIGDRAMARGDGSAMLYGNGNFQMGTDTWSNLQIVFPQGNVRVASRAQLNGRVLGRTLQFEPDVGAFGVPAFRFNPLFDDIFVTERDTLNWGDLMQFSLRMENTEGQGEGFANMDTRMELVAANSAETDSALLLPIVAMYKKYAMQSPGIRAYQTKGIAVLPENEISFGKTIVLSAPQELADVDNDAIDYWIVDLENYSYMLQSDSVVELNALNEGLHTLHFEGVLKSGNRIENYFTFQTVKPDSVGVEVEQ